MNKQTLIWTLIIAVPVGIAALATGYVYRDAGEVSDQRDGEARALQASSEAGDAPKSAAAPEKDAAPADGSVTTETAATDPAASESQTAGSAEIGITPSFDVVGVEPTGETVVAGRSDAGAIVALLANGKVVGKGIANNAGEWTIILDEPLKPGDYDVALEIHDQSGEKLASSEERVAVSIPEGGKEQPLVVLNTPDGPSDILQKPAAPEAVAEAPKPEETVVAAAPEPQAAGAGSETNAAGTPPETVVAGKSDLASSTQKTQTAAAPKTPAETAPAQTESQEASQSAAAETKTAQTDAGSSEAGGETAGTQIAAAPSAPLETETTSDQQQAATQPAGNAQTQAAAGGAASDSSGDTPVVTVEAVEAEKGKVYVAGTAEPGTSVRVYVGEDYQGEAKANPDGKWLVEGDKNVGEGDVEVRADVIAKDGNTVNARAAVVFEKEQDRQIILTKVVASGTGGSPETQSADVKKALPVVIIRKGDNLWRISRRLYGEGIRYTTIYQANQEQIRNPDLIYPGQVFLTPEGDINWPKEDGENG